MNWDNPSGTGGLELGDGAGVALMHIGNSGSATWDEIRFEGQGLSATQWLIGEDHGAVYVMSNAYYDTAYVQPNTSYSSIRMIQQPSNSAESYVRWDIAPEGASPPAFESVFVINEDFSLDLHGSSSGAIRLHTGTDGRYLWVESDYAGSQGLLVRGGASGGGYLVCYSTGQDKNVQVSHNDVDGEVIVSSGKLNVTATGGTADILGSLMVGSTNAEYVNCAFRGGYRSDESAAYFEVNAVGRIENTSSVDPDIYFELCIPHSRGGLSLYINGSKVSVGVADSSDYVETRNLYGYSGATRTPLDSNTSNLITAGSHTDSFTAQNVSGYDVVTFRLDITCETSSQLEINGVALRCYYA
jgi:hypothetical protein